MYDHMFSSFRVDLDWNNVFTLFLPSNLASLYLLYGDCKFIVNAPVTELRTFRLGNSVRLRSFVPSYRLYLPNQVNSFQQEALQDCDQS